MPIKMGTKCHKYTEEDFQRIARGDYLEGINKRSQQYAYERYLERQSNIKKIKPNARIGIYTRPLFTPQEDLLVLDSKFPKTHSKEECEQRRKYLVKNFCQVGWGSLIGTQTIHW